MMRRPCHMVRVSTMITGAVDVDGDDAAVAPFASFICSPTMLNAMTPQISQILQNE